MYEIRKDGGVIALTEKPNYIRRHADGLLHPLRRGGRTGSGRGRHGIPSDGAHGA